MKGETADWRDLFPTLAEGDRTSQDVLDAAGLAALPANQAVFHGGSECGSYLLVLSGSVRVQVLGEGGREAVLYRVVAGESCVLTTCCMLSGDHYPAEAFTETPVRALLVAKPAFDRALETAPAFRRFVFANLGLRIAQVIERIEEVTFRPIERRLAAYLLSHNDGAGAIRATHQEIAVELGTAREVVSRHLKRLESAGLVRLGRSAVTLLDPQGLRHLADAAM